MSRLDRYVVWAFVLAAAALIGALLWLAGPMDLARTVAA
jgi:hypothetical protein